MCARQLNGEALQDLNYEYDPVGNITSITDYALPVRHFANRRIEPVSRYGYDSLYQLIEATGWEAGSDNRGPSHLDPPQAVANYRQTYRYDSGGNLLELTHQGPQQHGRLLTAARHSNRCLSERNGVPPTEAEIAAAFDQNGNLLALEPGRELTWDVRNQLHQVTPIERDSQLNDMERYIYAADGMRQRKVRSTQTNARTVIADTRYLPGLETRNVDGDVVHVITVQAGLTTVQVLHWETPASRKVANDQYRYNLADHLGSCALELDSQAQVISRETYHPFGSTAFSERGDSSEESYRTLRYSGKERDATGLYYYGLRYYMPWVQRWVNPDPEGLIDGLNLYRMVRNNPVNMIDEIGLAGKRTNADEPPAPESKRFKTESKAGLFTKVTGSSPRVRDRHIESEGESESEDPEVLYRSLRPDELAPQIAGLRAPTGFDRGISAYEHINHGSKRLRKSMWISASRSIKVAGAWAAEGHRRVVKFSKPVKGKTFDLTSETGRAAMLEQHESLTGKMPGNQQTVAAINFAKGSQEVVVSLRVQRSRVLEVYEAKSITEEERRELIKTDPFLLEYDKVFKTRSRVTYKDTQQRITRWAKPETVLLKRIFSRDNR